MGMKWCTKLEVAKKRCSIVFEGHPLNFKVKRLKKSSILTKIGRFRTVTPVWIHWWLWNDTQSLKQHRRGALLFFDVICQISRSHGSKNCRFSPKLRVSGLLFQFEFTDGFEMMHKAWCSIEEVPFCFPWPSIKFLGHKGQKNRWFGSNLSKITRPVAAIKSLRFALFKTKQSIKLHFTSKFCSCIIGYNFTNINLMQIRLWGFHWW